MFVVKVMVSLFPVFIPFVDSVLSFALSMFTITYAAILTRNSFFLFSCLLLSPLCNGKLVSMVLMTW